MVRCNTNELGAHHWELSIAYLFDFVPTMGMQSKRNYGTINQLGQKHEEMKPLYKAMWSRVQSNVTKDTKQLDHDIN